MGLIASTSARLSELGVFHNLPAELAFELGSGFLTEVRRLQLLPGEREHEKRTI